MACSSDSTPPPREPTFVSDPVSDTLAIADLRVTLPAGGQSAVCDIRLSWRNDEIVRVHLHPDPDQPGELVGRAHLGELPRNQSIQAPMGTIIWTDTSGKQHNSQLHEINIAPPTTAPRTPDWAKGAVWYQIFPERFRNANPANDQTLEYTTMLPWNADWWTVHNAEIEDQWRRTGSRPAIYGFDPEGRAFAQLVWNRRYGGDLQGVVEQLDHIQSLGVTALYLNPVFHASSMHKYDATDFRHIDPFLAHPGDPFADGSDADPVVEEGVDPTDPQQWGWTAADRYFVDVFLPACHDRGMKVIIDGVFNHTGRRHWAFQHALEHGTDSPYAGWFYFKFRDDGSVKSWIAWDGPSGWLPKFKQTKSGDLVAPVKRQIMNITTRWMDPNGDGDPSDGIDGWRLDVPLDVGKPFWVDWNKHVKAINPDAVIVSEIWGEAGEWLTGDTFDAQMNYPFSSAVADFLALKRGETDAPALGARLRHVFNHHPQTDMIQQNLMCSHDTDRLASMLFNHGPRDYDANNRNEAVFAGTYSPDKPDPLSYKRSLLAVALQATCPGAPMIYYGDELGMHGPDDPSNRKPAQWPDGPKPQNPDDAPDLTILDAYRSWFNLREHETVGPVLRFGDFTPIDTGNPRVFAFTRTLNDRTVWVVVSDADKPFDQSAIVPAGAELLAGELRGKWLRPNEAAAWMD